MKIKSLTKVTDEAGFKGTSCLWKISILFVVIGLTLYIVGFATASWARLEYEQKGKFNPKNKTESPTLEVYRHFGLWRDCTKIESKGKIIEKKCENTNNDHDWKPAAKALCCVGLILLFFGLFTAVIGGGRHNGKLMGFGGVLIIVGAIVAVVGGAVFAGKSKEIYENVKPGYSVFLALIGCLILIIGGAGELFSIRSGYSTIA